MKPYTIRKILPGDNPSLARVIRDTLLEFGANRPGTVYDDPSTDHLFELFQAKGSAYFVAEMEGRIVGGGGIYPTVGLPADTSELVKMYLLPAARGIGLGRKIIEECLSHASAIGYRYVYLESMPELKQAIKIYEQFGFEHLKAPMGNSGHTGCQVWLIKSL